MCQYDVIICDTCHYDVIMCDTCHYDVTMICDICHYVRYVYCVFRVTAKNQGEAERKFMKADLHGSIILVAKSKCPSLLGLTGIVLQETKNTFRLVTKNNKLKSKFMNKIILK